MTRREGVPYRDSRAIAYFVKDGPDIRLLPYAEAVMVAADPNDRRRIFHAYVNADGVQVTAAGARFTALAKRAVRSAQERSERPRCTGVQFVSGEQCKVISVTEWRDLPVCAMHDPEGKFCADNPEYRDKVLSMLRTVKRTDVARMQDRLTALLLERFGPSKGKGVIG